MAWAPNFLSKKKNQLSEKWKLVTDNDNNEYSSSQQQMNEITQFDTVEDFWNVYKSIPTVSQVEKGKEIYFVKKELKSNTAQKIILTFNQTNQNYDEIIEEMLLLVIGSSIRFYLNIKALCYSFTSKLKIVLFVENLSIENVNDLISEIQEYLKCEFEMKFMEKESVCDCLSKTHLF